MPASPMKNGATTCAMHAVIAAHITKADQYIAHTKNIISMIRSQRSQTENSARPENENDEWVIIMLSVLATFEAHRQMLLELQQREAGPLSHWITEAGMEDVHMPGERTANQAAAQANPGRA